MKSIFKTHLTIFISLAALAGVSVHDTKIDKLTTVIIGTPAAASVAALGMGAMRGDDHTHVERVSLKDVKTHVPRTSPRNEQKKYFLQKNVPRGFHNFDFYNLPIA